MPTACLAADQPSINGGEGWCANIPAPPSSSPHWALIPEFPRGMSSTCSEPQSLWPSPHFPASFRAPLLTFPAITSK